ncbi:MAG: VanZ family protein [Spirochaetales bacterium]|nr:VanZ family protein [Spirochaetales bacterium]
MFQGFSAFTALMIGVLSLLPQTPEAPVTFPGIDKLFHAVSYAVLAFLMTGSLKNRRWSHMACILIACVVYGGLLEILQRYTGRTPEGLDLLFDGLGALFGGLAGRRYFNRKNPAQP